MNQRLTIFANCILLACLFVFLPTVSAAPGDLDLTFSLDGKIIDTLSGASSDRGQATAIQADGKIVIAGTLTLASRLGCGVARYNTNGTLDTTFDVDGKTAGLIGTTFTCRAVAIQTDGKIVVAGNTGSGQGADFALMRFNSNGSLDVSFGSGGQVTTPIASATYDIANAVAIQTDGKIVAVGGTNNGNANFALIRYNTNGSLDTTFDGDGKVSTDFAGTDEYANAMAIQADGKVVAAGFTGSGFALARYNADGSLDTSFDHDGKVTTVVSNGNERAYALAVQPDGRIVAAGYGYITVDSSSTSGFALARYNTDGSLDTTFDGDGKVVTSVAQYGGTAYAATVQTDGKIIATGYGYNNGTYGDFQLVRYNADGSLDTSFDVDGKVTTPVLGGNDYAYAATLQTDGKIIAAGSSENGNDNFALVRYNTDGSLDTSFDSDGKTTGDIGLPTTSGARETAIQADGKIVVAGYSYNGSNDDFTVVRYNADGTRDVTFDADGKVSTDITGNIWGERANAVTIQPDGKILVGGSTEPGSNTDFAIVRYNTDGSRDTSFDGDGIVITSFSPGSFEYIYDLAVQPDGKIIAAGYSYNGSNNDFAIARYNADGSLDTTFDGDGKVTTDFNNSNESAYAMKLQTDGKIVLAGSYSSDSNYDFAVVRYNANGSLDTSFDVDGKVTTNILGNDGASSVAIQANGKIIAAGSSADDFAVVRYNADGSLDASFGADGKTTANILGSDSLSAVAIQADGRIVAAGYSYPGANNNEAALARFNSDGSLDVSFGTDGKRTFDMLGGSNDFIYGMALDSSGRAVVAGESGGSFTVARVLGDFAPPARAPFDFDGDGKSDLSIFRPAVGEWWINKSSNGGNFAERFGNSSDKLAPADYTGDGKADIAFFRPSTGEWFILRSEDRTYYSFAFGATGDVPVPADYDRDGRADVAVFRPSNSTWYINKSGGGTIIQQFGQTGDVPVAADYDADGKADIAIWRSSAGQWWINRSAAGLIAIQFGNSMDKPVQGDYTGDGKTDIALFRPSTGEWFILRSEDNSFYSFPFGVNGDAPTPGDYDGDGKTDAAVFRPSNSNWYIQRSTAGTLIQQFGITGDRPLPNAFVP
jgi:uncharacterized delta-60 repeat protein